MARVRGRGEGVGDTTQGNRIDIIRHFGLNDINYLARSGEGRHKIWGWLPYDGDCLPRARVLGILVGLVEDLLRLVVGLRLFLAARG